MSKLYDTEKARWQILEHFAALERIAKIAANEGARAEDIVKARTWPLLWMAQVFLRAELEPMAELGRRVVRGNRDSPAVITDRDRAFGRKCQLVACGVRLLTTAERTHFCATGKRPRNLAKRVAAELDATESERHVNRMLKDGFEAIFVDLYRGVGPSK